MSTDQRLNQVAESYKAQGYQVVIRPGPEALPPFAKDFKVEILAVRPDVSVLASAKDTPADLADDPNVPEYAEITGKQKGWRYDLFIMGGDGPPPTTEKRKVPELSEDDIVKALDEVDRMHQAGYVAPSLGAAWAALEAAMRRRLRAEGQNAGWGALPRTMLNELYSAGVFSNTTFRNLEGLFQLRSEVVHGFAASVIEPSAVRFLVDTARRLLTESQPKRQTA